VAGETLVYAEEKPNCDSINDEKVNENRTDVSIP